MVGLKHGFFEKYAFIGINKNGPGAVSLLTPGFSLVFARALFRLTPGGLSRVSGSGIAGKMVEVVQAERRGKVVLG